MSYAILITLWVVSITLGVGLGFRALRDFSSDSDGKESACNGEDLGLIPGLGRSPGEENSYPLQYCGLENSMDRGAWKATVHGAAESQTWLSNFHFHFQALLAFIAPPALFFSIMEYIPKDY